MLMHPESYWKDSSAVNALDSKQKAIESHVLHHTFQMHPSFNAAYPKVASHGQSPSHVQHQHSNKDLQHQHAHSELMVSALIANQPPLTPNTERQPPSYPVTTGQHPGNALAWPLRLPLPPIKKPSRQNFPDVTKYLHLIRHERGRPKKDDSLAVMQLYSFVKNFKSPKALYENRLSSTECFKDENTLFQVDNQSARFTSSPKAMSKLERPWTHLGEIQKFIPQIPQTSHPSHLLDLAGPSTAFQLSQREKIILQLQLYMQLSDKIMTREAQLEALSQAIISLQNILKNLSESCAISS
jgi:hypothetical protein